MLHEPFLTVTITPFSILLALSLILNIVLLWNESASKPRQRRKSSGTLTTLESAALRRRQEEPPPPVISSMAAAVEQLAEMKKSQRYLEAGALLDALRATELKGSGSWLGSWSEWGIEATQTRLSALLADGQLQERIEICRQAVRDLNSDDGFSEVLSGTHRRRNSKAAAS